jgi:hypothetical protein
MLTLAMVVLTACGGDTAEPSGRGGDLDKASTQNVVEVVATEYSYSMPDEVTGGVVTFEMVNGGREPHIFTLVRVPEGKSVDDLLRALEHGGLPRGPKARSG